MKDSNYFFMTSGNEFFMCFNLFLTFFVIILQFQSSKFEGLLTAVLGYVIIAFSLILCHVSFFTRNVTLMYFLENLKIVKVNESLWGVGWVRLADFR